MNDVTVLRTPDCVTLDTVSVNTVPASRPVSARVDGAVLTGDGGGMGGLPLDRLYARPLAVRLYTNDRRPGDASAPGAFITKVAVVAVVMPSGTLSSTGAGGGAASTHHVYACVAPTLPDKSSARVDSTKRVVGLACTRADTTAVRSMPPSVVVTLFHVSSDDDVCVTQLVVPVNDSIAHCM